MVEVHSPEILAVAIAFCVFGVMLMNILQMRENESKRRHELRRKNCGLTYHKKLVGTQIFGSRV